MKVMIVDDEADLREILSFNLQSWGYEPICAESAEKALALIVGGNAPDLILLDVMLPGMSGFKFADYLRRQLHISIPIIFLTARSDENDLLTGFSAGGDDYISKPFSINEVQARIKAVLRRCADRGSSSGGTSIELGNLLINTEDKKVYIKNEELQLSRKEYDILVLLCSNAGKYFSRKEILKLLWQDSPYVLERTVDVHIARIRAKLTNAGCSAAIINRTGFGYIIKNRS